MYQPRAMAGIAAASAFLACIVAANYAVSRFGMVPVGIGLVAPAGVYFAGLTFVLRDTVQDTLGRWVTIALVVAGAALSALISPQLAVASGAAFLLAELADLAVYTPLRRRGYIRAALASNIVGAVVDSLVFLTLAGFPLALALPGQVVGKLWITAAVVAAVTLVRGTRKAAHA
jgi:queuosine precursor transporter